MSTRHINTLAAIAEAQPAGARTDVLTAPAGTLLARYQNDSIGVRETAHSRGPIGAGQTLTIAPGQTYVLNTTVATGGVLLIDGNAPGMLTPGLVTTNNYGVNDGAIGIYGGSVPYSGTATSQSHTGGLFAVTGTFVNNGAISVAGGLGGYKASVPGGLINVTGIFINNGAIDLGGAAPHGHVGGSGALALNYGQLLSNTGLITVEGATGGIGASLASLRHLHQ